VEAVEWIWDKNRAGENVVEERRNRLPDLLSCILGLSEQKTYVIGCRPALADPAAVVFSQHYQLNPEDLVRPSAPNFRAHL
jgi:glutathione S-transferase